MATKMSRVTEEEFQRRDRRKYSYHLVASKNKLPSDPEEEYDDMLFRYLTTIGKGVRCDNLQRLQNAKLHLLRVLAQSGGDVLTAEFQDALDSLVQLYDSSTFDARKRPSRSSRSSGTSSRGQTPSSSPQLEGMWISLAKPNFGDSAGFNTKGDRIYTLGRMSFGMFHPTDLVCSIQGTFNPVHVVRSKERAAIKSIPPDLKQEVENGRNVVRTYNIVTAFTIEPQDPEIGPGAPNAIVDVPIEGLMTTYGYVISNPEMPNRLSTFFTSGTIEVTDDRRRWSKVFNSSNKSLSSQTQGKAAAPVVVMEEDGRMSYMLDNQFGGAVAYVDMLYLDETLRISRSHSGIIHVAARIPHFPDE